ncbi:MAG: hypothetical protein PHQ52_05695 [Candidatus Omnitrophica bacterium]|nr:hypothetical protein [Candidatus Omnitrophota bacterium]
MFFIIPIPRKTDIIEVVITKIITDKCFVGKLVRGVMAIPVMVDKPIAISVIPINFNKAW